VDPEEIFGITAVIITMAMLIPASIKDWKDREIPDGYWIVLGVAGLAMSVAYSIYLTGFRWEYACLAAGTVMILLDIFLDREFNPLIFYFLMAVLFIVPLYGNLSDDVFRAWATVPVCYIIFVGMYFLGVVRGGADTKCLITLSIMFPIYYTFFGLPVISIPAGLFSQMFVFSIMALFIAAVLVIPITLYLAVRNAVKGEVSRKMFSGYRMSISQAEKANVWPLEDIVEGVLKHTKIPKEEDMKVIYARLREAGRENVWVTPMIPFIVLITIAVVVLFIFGNPLFLIV